MTSHQLLAEWSQRFWPAFANHLWQATLFAFVVWIASLWLGQAKTRHTVWLMAFAKFLLPSALLFLMAQGAGLNLSWPARTEMTATVDAEVLLQIAGPVEQSDAGAAHNEVYCLLTTLWLVGVAACFARWGWRRRRFAAVALGGEKVEAGREAEMLEDLKSRLNVGRQVGLVVSSSFAEPAVWRALRPVIVLPRGLAERLSDGELESVLKHELFHVKRLDNLFGSLQMFVCCLFWFHPLVRLIDRRLIEERELMCDERVILSGAAPEAYAASLWKVVQFGFGWPVDGVSRAAGSNLKRRIKLMLNASHRSKSSSASRALAGITFVALIALAAAMALLSRGGVADAKAPYAQDQKFVATAPAQFENLPDIPLVITDARLSVGEPRVMTNGDPDKGPSHMAVRGETARDVEFVANLVNHSDRRVTAFIVQIQNATFWAGLPLDTMSNPITNSGAPGKQGIVEPQESFTFKTQLPLQDKKDDQDLMNHIYDFSIRITGVKFEFDEYWLIAQPGKTPSTTRAMMTFAVPREVAVQGMKVIREMRKKDSVSDQAQVVTGPIEQMSVSLRPTILYREKAQYTREAKDNKVEGVVILRVVFGVDGQVSDINVVRGLPYGLTENAIIAAKKIRFEPAVKDGRPVSVRGNLEFNFKLYDDPIEQMSVSLRPTVLYREKAQYTQEAKDNKVEGTVILSAVFGVDGRIGEIGVIQGLPNGLTQSAIEAAKKMRFEPAMKDGRPVSVRGNLEFSFNLDK
ncbi:MAG TPA: M56 family metallopeptidase [Blastocatellia bacterium]|nr:M56 family metallopeptidase [Blastocatellia bacterium]